MDCSVAYVEFYTQESVLKAIGLNGKDLNGNSDWFRIMRNNNNMTAGHSVKIQPSQAEKNRAAAAAK